MKHRVYFIIGGILFTCAIAAFGFTALAQRQANNDAKNMCSAFKPGITVEQAQKIASSNNGQVSSTAPTEFIARTSGGGLICSCRVATTRGVIASVKGVLCLN